MKTALLIIDMLNTMDFPEASQLVTAAVPVAKKIRQLSARARRKGMPVIYVNDNFKHWKDDWKSIYEMCIQEDCPGAPLAKELKPEPTDYFILKPRHSGFYCTSLEILLQDLSVKRLILTGIAGNICVWFTANDAHMRDFEIWVPRDCVASNTEHENNFALQQMKEVLKVRTSLSKSSL